MSCEAAESIADAMDMSRIESGKVKISENPLHLPDLLHDIRTIVQPNIVSKQLEFLIDTVDARDEDIIADKHIFETFTREETSTVSGIQGTGLGMAITKNIVDMMGGTIAVESEKGKGTTVTVDLPLELSDYIKEEPKEKHRRREDTKDLRVLLAEDNDLNAEIATVLLEDKGMHVTRAIDGFEAMEMFKKQPMDTFDVVLMDIMVPRMDGYEATRAIRHMENRPDGQAIPIIAMTANAFAEDAQAALEAGMNAHPTKPIVIDTMTAAILDNLKSGE